MTVVDLRRALPSVFLRPGAQHGWTVKMNSNKKNMSRGDYSFAKDVVAILRIPLSLADDRSGRKESRECQKLNRKIVVRL